MKSVSRIALGVALVLGGASVVATAPAEAQKKKKQQAQPAQPAARVLKLSKEERAALQPLQAAITAKDWATAAAALPAAQAAAQGADAKYAPSMRSSPAAVCRRRRWPFCTRTRPLSRTMPATSRRPKRPSRE
jgi:hypothetical protein